MKRPPRYWMVWLDTRRRALTAPGAEPFRASDGQVGVWREILYCRPPKHLDHWASNIPCQFVDLHSGDILKTNLDLREAVHVATTHWPARERAEREHWKPTS